MTLNLHWHNFAEPVLIVYLLISCLPLSVVNPSLGRFLTN